jgi:hypothetical protein
MIKPIIRYAVVALGISVVSYAGFTIIFDSVTDYIYSNYNSLPVDLLRILDLMGVHSAIKMLMSTMLALAGYKAALAPTRAVWKKPGSTPSISA